MIAPSVHRWKHPPTHTYVHRFTHTNVQTTKVIFHSNLKRCLSRTEDCNVKRQSLPKEDDGGSCVPEAVDVGKKVREAFDHQAMEEIER